MNERAQLMRRAGFGLAPGEADRGYEQTVEELVAGLDEPAPPNPPSFDPYRPGAPEMAWLSRMTSGRNPLAEKLALFWHGHFATSNRKVQDPALMWRQYQLFRERGGGSFEKLVEGVSRDVAMLIWLDGNSNVAGNANENYARELMELFTLGRGHYTEQDVREGARAFTGWTTYRGRFRWRPDLHDDGVKHFLGHTGNFDGDDVVAIICAKPQCAEFICTKLACYFVRPDPSPGLVSRLTRVFTRTHGQIKEVVRAMLLDSEFRSAAAYRSLIKSPVEFLVGALRVTGQTSPPDWSVTRLWRMGQALFYPPSVNGWPGGVSWLSGGGVVERFHVADQVARLARSPQQALAVAFDGDPPPSTSLPVALSSPLFQIQ